MKNIVLFSSCLLSLFILCYACTRRKPAEVTKSGLKKKAFESMQDGQSTDLYVLRNANGAELCVTNYGGRVVSLMVPGRDGALRDVVLGFDSIGGYTEKPSSFGAVIGRFANRIARATFPLDGRAVPLDVNSGQHSIHGGALGWQRQVFAAEQLSTSSLLLRYTAADGEGGYPGTVQVEVTYQLLPDNSVHISYAATTDKKTVINLTNHSFFNLSGDASQDVLSHTLYVNASQITPLQDDLITDGRMVAVAGTAFDLRTPVAIGDALQRPGQQEQLALVQGFDHNFVLDTQGDTSVLAAQLYSPSSGITMDVYTDQPGLQVYSANMLDGSRTGKRGIVYEKQTAICLEAQRFPDTPNKAHWPSAVLLPGDTYRHTCIYRFGVRD